MKARDRFVLVTCVAMIIAGGDTYGQTPATSGLCYATPTGQAAAFNLVTVDLATGTGTIVAPLSIESGFPGLAINSSGDIYATGWDGDDGLYRIDAADGTVTQVATMDGAFIGGLAFDDSDVLYGINADADEIVIIDIGTGAWSFVGDPGPLLYAGLDFDPTDGSLWGSTSGAAIFPVPGGVPDAISTFSLVDGTPTVVGTTGLGGGTPSIAFDGDGNLFGVKGGSGGSSTLISIDKSTGLGTVVGPIGFSVTGLDCFMDPTPPEPEGRQQVCHNPSGKPGKEKTLNVDASSLADHLGHGDTLGPCEGDEEGDEEGEGPGKGKKKGHDKTGKGELALPSGFDLSQNYPNPFNPTTTISFALPEAASVRLTVHNALGQEVKVLVSSALGAGIHSATWDATDHSGRRVATGLYFYRLAAGDFVQTRKMLLLE